MKETFSDTLNIARSPRGGLKSLYDVSLYRNAVYLMINSTALGLTGFFFWTASARFYSPEEVGLTSAAISAMMLLSLIAMVGLDYALIRFIPGAGENTRDIINSCFTIGGVASITLALVFIAGLSFWSPALYPIREQPVLFAVFVVSVAATTLFNMAQRVFIAKRKSSFALAIGLVFGLLRFIPLAILAAYSATLGIFASWGIATFMSVAIGILFLLPRVEPRYRPSLTIRKDILAPMVHFASANFLANVSLTITGFVLPLVVINVLGEEQNAYFYVTWAFSSILFAALGAVTINLFAEGSHDQQKLRDYVKKSLKLMTLILIPAVTLTLLLGDKLLLVFGEGYSQNATHLLWLLILSAVPVSVNYTYISIMRVGTQMRGILVITLFVAIATLGSSPYLLSLMGITGVGVAWLASQGVVAIFTGRQILRLLSEV